MFLLAARATVVEKDAAGGIDVNAKPRGCSDSLDNCTLRSELDLEESGEDLARESMELLNGIHADRVEKCLVDAST